jgi:predicted dehydrogenase
MPPLSIGLVGAGRLGTYHARCMASVPNATLAGILDLDRQKAEALAAETSTKVFADYQEMLNNVHAVIIAVDTQHHYDLGIQAIHHGRHMFIEKPITATVDQGRELVKEARKRGLKLQVGHVERYNRAFRSLVNRPVDPRFIEAHRLSQFNPRGTDVAVVLDLMIHDLDLILYLVDAEIESIDASGVAIVSETIDIANARLNFVNGCVANVTASRISQRKMRKMRVFSTDSYVSMDFITGKTDVFRLADRGDEQAPGTFALGEIEKGQRELKILFESPEAEEANAIEMELRDFVNCVIHNTTESITGEQGLRALELAMLINDTIDAQTRKYKNVKK